MGLIKKNYLPFVITFKLRVTEKGVDITVVILVEINLSGFIN